MQIAQTFTMGGRDGDRRTKAKTPSIGNARLPCFTFAFIANNQHIRPDRRIELAKKLSAGVMPSLASKTSKVNQQG